MNKDLRGRPAKVFHILTDPNVGGAGRQLTYMMGCADRERFEYTVVVPEGSRMAERFAAAGVRTLEIPEMDRSFSPPAAPRLFRLLKVESPDIVHTHSSFTGRVAALKAGIPVRIMTKHSSDPPPRAASSFPGKLFCGLHWRRTLTAAIATDDASAGSLAACGVPESYINIIYNGAPEPRIPAEAEKKALRNSIGLPEDAIACGTFSRLEPEKDIVTLLRAAALCLRRAPNVRFLVCGDGSKEAELRELCSRYGLNGKVIFCGFVSDPAAYMSLCRIIISPSRSVETTSLSVIEGMSMGLVPVVTDVGGSPLLAEGCGVCVPTCDPPALADAVLSVLRDSAKAKIMSEAAVRRYSERFTARRMAEMTEKIYLRALGL